MFSSHSIYFPLPLIVHIFIVVLSDAVMAFGFFRKRCLYMLLLAAGMSMTFLIYFARSTVFVTVLGFFEFAVFIAVCIFMRIEKKNGGLLINKYTKGEHYK